MKLVTFDAGKGAMPGALGSKGIVDLSPLVESIQALIEGGEALLQVAREHEASATEFVSPDDSRLLAPIPRPVQIRDSLGFEEHAINAYENGLQIMVQQNPGTTVEEMRNRTPNTMLDAMRRQPIYYKANRFAVTGPGTDILWPAYSRVMDFELEMACIIGHKGCDIPKAEAHDYIFGYTIFNDFSARDAQMLEMPAMLGPCKGKDFDNANVFGPVITTADEIGDPYNLVMQARINGVTLCDNSSSTMNVRFDAMIEHISRGETLYPGEFICSGTVGRGCGLEHGRFLEDGDVVELEIEKIGVLSNRVFRASHDG